MKLSIETQVLSLPLRDPFRIARHEDDRTATTVIVQVAVAGLTGVGEAFPVAYYGETVGTIGVVLPQLAGVVGALDEPPTNLPEARAWLADAARRMAAAIGHHGGAKAGLDIALHDLVARGLGIPLWRLMDTPAEIPPTDFSLGIDTPGAVAERASRAIDFPMLKVKVGGPSDLATLEAVRAVYGGPLRVDANTGWLPEDGARLLPELVRLGVELIEQPFPARQLPQLRWLQERSSIPIVADESAVTIDDLDALVGVVAGVNVKLTKCGGVGPGAGHDAPRAGAGLPGDARLHGGDERGYRGRGGPRRPRGLGRPGRQPAPGTGPLGRSGAGRRQALATDRCARPGGPPAPRLTADGGLWTRWWTSRWMAHLPLSGRRTYHLWRRPDAP